MDGLYKTGRTARLYVKEHRGVPLSRSSSFDAVILASVAFGALCAGAGTAQAQFQQTNLVSDIAGLAAIEDPNLKNTWGVSNLPGSPFWISN